MPALMQFTSILTREGSMMRKNRIFAVVGGLAVLILSADVCRAAPVFQQTNLVSSVPGVAPVTDPHLKNPWGISFSPSGPFWVSNQADTSGAGTGTATLYSGAGQPFPNGNPLVVTITSVGGTARRGPTGVAFNSTTDFRLPPAPAAGNPAAFLFANLDGTISGWNATLGTATSIQVIQPGAVFTGLTLGNNGTGNFLYAADTANNQIRVYDASFAATALGSFLDPNLPAGFTAYNVQSLGGTLYVTYQNESSGGGVIDAFDLNGNLLRRVSGNGPGGPLDDPWGLTLAPAGFGTFGGALLVGNERNGRISAFDAQTGQFLGQLLDGQNNPIANPGLWGLTFGNGGVGGSPDVLYFTAGIASETEGLFGAISTVPPSDVPEPTSFLLVGAGWLAIVVAHRRVGGAKTALGQRVRGTTWSLPRS
jgi:uncharacterized protein (TIGR03118 family)